MWKSPSLPRHHRARRGQTVSMGEGPVRVNVAPLQASPEGWRALTVGEDGRCRRRGERKGKERKGRWNQAKPRVWTPTFRSLVWMNAWTRMLSGRWADGQQVKQRGCPFFSFQLTCELFNCPSCLVLEFWCKYWLSIQSKYPLPVFASAAHYPQLTINIIRLEMEHLNF